MRRAHAAFAPSGAVPLRGAARPAPTCRPRAMPRAALDVARIARVWESRGAADDGALRDSPLARRDGHFVDGEAVLADVVLDAEAAQPVAPRAYMRAGPRRKVVYGRDARAAIVTCGGIAPGLATVVREIVMCLCREYGLGFVFGVEYGFRGFYGRGWTKLVPEGVAGLHREGGTPLGSSRGGFDLVKIVDAIETRKLDMVFIVGGDGTMMATMKIYEEVQRRGLPIAVCHVPKTVDKDIPLLSTTFGFDTAVEEAQRSISAAIVESRSFPDCVAIVKLMGRNSGFIAANATLASRDVDCCLIPEVPFALHGPGGVLEYIERVLDDQGRCVIVVAEGAGQELTGNTENIGLYISDAVKRYFHDRGRDCSHKYLDPTYQVRALPPIASDNMLCTLLAHAAVHGAMAGMTGCCFGPIHNHNCIIPLREVAGRQDKVDPMGRVWQRVVSSTRQPEWAPPPDAAGDADVHAEVASGGAPEGDALESMSASSAVSS